MKVKLFVADDLKEIELQINEFLQASSIQVHHITQSQSNQKGKFLFVTGIYYYQRPNTKQWKV